MNELNIKDNQMLKQNQSATGQGLTEYINIVALVAITSITVFSAFGGVNRSQVASLANEIAGNGQGATDALSAAQDHAQLAGLSAAQSRGMGNYSAYTNDTQNSGTSTTSGSSASNSSTNSSAANGSTAGTSGSSGTSSSGSATNGTTAGVSSPDASGADFSNPEDSSANNSTAGGIGNNAESSELADIPPPPEQPSAILPHPVGQTPKPAPPIKEQALLTTNLGTAVDKLISKSASLTRDVKAILANPNWTLQYGAKSQIDRKKKLITIKKETTSLIVQSIAHEIGHALYIPPSNVDFMGLTEKEYVDQSVKIQMDDEGEATFYNLQVRAEIIAKTEIRNQAGKITKAGIDIDVAGVNKASYESIYKKHLAGEFTRKETTAAMGRIFGNKEKATATQTYYQYHQTGYLKYFRDNVIVNSAGKAHGYWYIDKTSGQRKPYIKN